MKKAGLYVFTVVHVYLIVYTFKTFRTSENLDYINMYFTLINQQSIKTYCFHTYVSYTASAYISINE